MIHTARQIRKRKGYRGQTPEIVNELSFCARYASENLLSFKNIPKGIKNKALEQGKSSAGYTEVYWPLSSCVCLRKDQCRL